MYYRNIFIMLALVIVTPMFASMAIAAEKLERVTTEGEKRTQEGAAAQNKIDKVSDATTDLVSKFRTENKIVDGLIIYNDLLQIQIDKQRAEVISIQESIANVGLVERQVVPLMVRMIDSLDQFIQLDIPFLAEERNNRIAKLRKMMLRSDVSNAEKFRRVIEAYQIENDYGRTIEAYKGNLTIEDRTRVVDFLRVGRISLLYQSVGRDSTGAWDTESGQWIELPSSEYKNHVKKGLRIARKQVAPDLLVLPIQAARELGQ